LYEKGERGRGYDRTGDIASTTVVGQYSVNTPLWKGGLIEVG
jgi:hypothetical protein